MTAGGGPVPEEEPTRPRRRVGPYEASLQESAHQAEVAHRARMRAARRRHALIAAVTVVALVAVGFVGWRLLTPAAPPTSVPATAAAPVSCTDATAVTIAAAPAVAPVLAALAETLSKEASGPCAAFTIEPVESFTVSGTVGTAAEPDAWVTDSAEWIARAGTLAGREITVPEPFASTGVVVALPVPAAEEIGDQAKWSAAITSRTPVRVPDPARYAVGAAALASAAGGLPPDRVAAVAQANASAPAPGLGAVAEAATPLGVVVTAAQLLAHNESNDARALAAVAPVDGAAFLGYRLVTLTDKAEVAELVADFAAYLTTEEAKTAFSEAGFATPGGPEPQMPSPLYGTVTDRPAPDAAALKAVRAAWAAATPKRQTLLALDVSGSMLRRTDQGTRLAVMQEATLQAIAGMPGSSRLGLWAYSLHIGKQGDDFRPLLNAAPVGHSSHLLDLRKQVGGLTRSVGGGRGLYDTIVATYQRARATYTKGQLNSVVIVTDGLNDDDYGASLSVALSRVKKLVDPRNPIRITIVGFGSEPDAKAMTPFAQLTGGRYVNAAEPKDLLPTLRGVLGG
ncbi:von Willebrand factor type A [Intrasporangium calvum DSM 43043]|uniref:von Willebrand factor type A n=1 Tax=Intrasporangium calvum (strain ATCC 23552 / DSM 43043 / JCM 3097 / NBRC 12989 / NCIMB 10167 / NRRL B-3866 / 7 KIP) TaxID=710696 RepID=E6S914_INTC7|nr:von Willebrand factor type A [Intrasporangium calvum DSM 43043]